VWTKDALLILSTRVMHKIIAKSRYQLNKAMSMAQFPTKHEDQFVQLLREA
jgi:hypothetical protein